MQNDLIIRNEKTRFRKDGCISWGNLLLYTNKTSNEQFWNSRVSRSEQSKEIFIADKLIKLGLHCYMHR